MTGWLIALGVLVVLWLLGRIRLGIRVEYNQGATAVRLRIGPFPITLYPQKEAETPAEPVQEKKKKRGKQDRPEMKKQKQRHSIPPVGQLLEMAAQAAGALRRKICVDELTVHITWADSDPAQAALGFGRANGVLGMIWALIDHNFRVKHHDLGVAVDFQGEKPLYFLKAALSMTVGQLLAFGLRFGGKLLMIWSRGQKAAEIKQEASA